MEITDIRLKLIRDASDRLKAVCTITFDGEFVVRDVKVVEGTSGLFVAMPSRKLSVACHQCRHKNHLRARFCNECGAKLTVQDTPPDPDGRTRLHRDVAHPITTAFREAMQQHVIEAYRSEAERPQEPDYDPAEVDEASGEAERSQESDYKRDEADEVSGEDERSQESDYKRDEADEVSGEEERSQEPDYKPDEIDEVSGEVDEYSALISDLKGGPTESKDQRERRDGSGGGERRRGRGSRGRRRGPGPSERRPEEPETAVSEADPDAISPSEDTGVTGDEPCEEEPVPMDKPVPVDEPVADAVALDEVEAKPAPSEDSSDDTAAFGVGLV